jgi:hypothetical protein
MTKHPTEKQVRDYATTIGFPIDQSTTYESFTEDGFPYGSLRTDKFHLVCWILDSGNLYGEW